MQPVWQWSSEAVEVDGALYIDVQLHDASDPSGEQAQHGQQEAPAVQLNGHGHETPEEQARRFGNLVGDAPQRIIIGGENPSAWAQGYVPHPTLSQRHLPVR